MATIAPTSPTKITPVGFTDLSGKDMVKIALLKTAKVAIVVLSAAAIATAIWFLAPVAIPAGMFIFGGSMAGLAGGGAILTTIEAVAFKKLNQSEDNIYSRYVKLETNLKEAIVTEAQKDEDNPNSLDSDEGFENFKQISYTQFDLDKPRGYTTIFNDDVIKDPTILSNSGLDRDGEIIVLAISRQLIASVLKTELSMHMVGSKSLIHSLFEKNEDEPVFIGTFGGTLIHEELSKSISESAPTEIVHNSNKRNTTVSIYLQVTQPPKGLKDSNVLGYLKVNCVLGWDGGATILVEKIMDKGQIPIVTEEHPLGTSH